MVINDSMTFSTVRLNLAFNFWPYVLTGRAVGTTLVSAPYLNYTANDLSSSDTTFTQLHELAHSLGTITGGDNSETAAKAFTRCLVRQK
jgi:hypothetical protein